MNIIGVDDQKTIIVTLEKMLKKIDPDGHHRFYYDPVAAAGDLDLPLDVAFLDVEMPNMDGVELAKRIMDLHPRCSIIFLTGHTEYMCSAFGLHASGYLLKPFSLGMVRDALEHRRYRSSEAEEKPVRVQCFGSFEVFVDQKPVHFSRNKAKELFAFLIDNRGRMCDIDIIIRNIDPSSETDESSKSKARVYIRSLIKSFSDVGIDDIILKNQGVVGVNESLIDCDYYRLLDNEKPALSDFLGEYMTQYEFAEETRAMLYKKFLK